MSDSPSGNPQARASTFYPFSMPDDNQAPLTRPPEMESSEEFISVDPVVLRGSIVLTVALPAFAVGCLVGMLL